MHQLNIGKITDDVNLVIPAPPIPDSEVQISIMKNAEVTYKVVDKAAVARIKVVGYDCDGNKLAAFTLSDPKSKAGQTFVANAKKFLRVAQKKHEFKEN